MRDPKQKILLTPLAARAYAGLKQKDAAEKLGLSVNLLVMYEKGRMPDDKILDKMCDVYNLNRDDFLLQ